MAASVTDGKRVANGIAAGVGGIGALALASRCFPHAFAADATQTFLPSTFSRLSYPLHYWKGPGDLPRARDPFLLRVAVAGGSRPAAALAAAPIPALACAVYLASWRGGWAVAVVGGLAFVETIHG